MYIGTERRFDWNAQKGQRLPHIDEENIRRDFMLPGKNRILYKERQGNYPISKMNNTDRIIVISRERILL